MKINNRVIQVLSLEVGKPCSVAWSPDSTRLVMGDTQGRVTVMLTEGRRLWQQIEHSAYVSNVSWSSNSRKIASVGKDRELLIWDATLGQIILHHNSEFYISTISWSPDSKLLTFGTDAGSLEILDTTTGGSILEFSAHSESINCVSWSPDGKWLVSGSNDKTIKIWNAESGKCLRNLERHTDSVLSLSWSPDGKELASGSEDKILRIWKTGTWECIAIYQGHNQGISSLSWSSNGDLIASGSLDKTLRLWSTDSGKEILKFDNRNDEILSVAFSPDSSRLALVSGDGTIKLWDVTKILSDHDKDKNISNMLTDYITRQAATVGQQVQEDTLSVEIFPLPSFPNLLPTALAQMLRLGIYPPLSLVQDLLDLTGGHPVNNSLTQLAQDTSTGIPDLIALRWSAPARIGLVALLLHKIPFTDWKPPSYISPREISAALQAALKGEPMEPEAPPPPISLLREAGKLIDEKLLSLLTILGAKAVETEPALPLRLLSRVPDLPALSSLQRQLLGVRVCFGNRSGRSIGNAPGAERGQVSGVEASSKTDWISLLPSQLALPQPVIEYRHHRGELLFRTRELAEPPRLRPTVLLLDVTPPAFGPVEAITRIAAFAVANSLRQADIPVVLITTGEEEDRILQLDNPENLVEIWTERSLAPANEVRTLKLANAVRTNLKDESGQEPMILLLTQPWFGAEKNMPRVPGLRGLFIQYPTMDVEPSIVHLCERWETLAAGKTAELGQILGYLMG